MSSSAGSLFRKALAEEKPLALPGAFNPCTALILQRAGFRAAYLSGSGVAAALGLPDLGMTTLSEVTIETRRIAAIAPQLPLLVDIDTGFGSELMIERTIRELVHAGAGAIHIEDQEAMKRCGHRPNKRIVPAEEMCARIRAADRARREVDPSFFLIARTDAYAQEGLEGTIARCKAYIEAGADGLFPEAMTSLDEYAKLCAAVTVPVLANITEFGKTPLFTVEELRGAGVSMALFPLSMFRRALGAVAAAAVELRATGTQRGFVDSMMTRNDFYDLISYHEYERRADAAAR